MNAIAYKDKDMKRVIILLIGCFLMIACTNQEQIDREAKAKIEQDSKERYLSEQREWNEIKSLALKATGVTSSVKEERKLSYVKLIQKFPNSNRWDDISRSIELDKMYSEYDEFLWEIKKAKGWVEIE